MKENRKTEVRVGITVVIAVILFVLIFGWAKNLIVGSGNHMLSVKFNSVSGLEKGDPVTINGVRKGHVAEIVTDADSVLVKLNLDSDALLKTDAKFYVSMLDLMGGKKVEIYPGSAQTLIDYSKLQTGSFNGDVASAMAMVGSAQSDLKYLLSEFKVTLTNINALLGDKQFTSDIKNSVIALKKMTEKVSVMLSENQENISKLVKKGAELADNANNLIVENKDDIKTTVKQANELIRNSNKLVLKLTKFSDEITNKQNSIGKLLYDDQFINDLKLTIKQTKDLTTILIKQLESKGIKVEADVSLF